MYKYKHDLPRGLEPRLFYLSPGIVWFFRNRPQRKGKSGRSALASLLLHPVYESVFRRLSSRVSQRGRREGVEKRELLEAQGRKEAARREEQRCHKDRLVHAEERTLRQPRGGGGTDKRNPAMTRTRPRTEVRLGETACIHAESEIERCAMLSSLSERATGKRLRETEASILQGMAGREAGDSEAQRGRRDERRGIQIRCQDAGSRSVRVREARRSRGRGVGSS